MRKRIFYPKMALSNLWRNRKTYLPYLLACVVSVFTFFTIVAINTNGALDGIRGETVVRSFTLIASVILAIFCGILIFYTNSFLIKRRKKELGLYSILGMEKMNIAFIMFFETIFIAIIALAAGIGLGLLFSRLLFWLLLTMVQFPVMINMQFSLTAVIVTLALFGTIFFLTLITNLRQVRIANPIVLLAGARQGEKEPKAGIITTLAGFILLGGGYYTALHFTSPLEALMFFLLAVALVIAGTYFLFTSCSVAILKILRKNKKYYYQPNHFITVSGMIYRMKQNAAGLSTICILSCMVLVTVSSTVSLNVGAEDSLKAQFPYEYGISFGAAEDADIALSGARETAQKNNAQIINFTDYNEAEFAVEENQGIFNIRTSAPVDLNSITLLGLFTLDEYNRNEGTNVALNEGEALLFVTGGDYNRNEITVNGFTYSVKKLESFGKLISGQTALSRSIVIVLPDRENAEAILSAAGDARITRERSLNFDIEGSEEAKEAFNVEFNSFIKGLENLNGSISTFIRDNNRESWYASNGGFLFLGVYFGILFMLATALIIYYKQMSEGYDDTERFEILQKVGMSETEVKKTINRQVLAIFFLPLIVAIIHVTVAFFPVSRVMIIFGVVNIPMLVVSSAVTILVYTLVYLIVFRRTARTYFGIVKRQSI